jgi:Autographiviridae endonuclease VII
MRTPWGIPSAVRAEQTAKAEQEAAVEQHLKPDSQAQDKTPASKWCPRRQSEKPVSDFAPLRNGLLFAYCRPCANAYTREYRRKNPAQPGARRGVHLLRTYGISRAEYNEMLAAQWGLCAIWCKGENTIGGRTGKTPMVLSVDHDHHTGKVRGLLCSACNRGIGSFGHDAKLLLAAARYLDRREG